MEAKQSGFAKWMSSFFPISYWMNIVCTPDLKGLGEIEHLIPKKRYMLTLQPFTSIEGYS